MLLIMHVVSYPSKMTEWKWVQRLAILMFPSHLPSQEHVVNSTGGMLLIPSVYGNSDQYLHRSSWNGLE